MKTQNFKMNRLQWILAGVLVLQLILAVVVNLPQSTQASAGPLLEGYDPAGIVKVMIENQSGSQIHLQKVNGAWVLPKRGQFPVRGVKVSELLGKIKNVQTDRMVTQTAASHNQLQVAEDEFLSQIILEDEGGKSYILFLGSSGGAGATHIRHSGSDRVYLTAELASWEVSPSVASWIETGYLSLDAKQLLSISVQNPNGTFDFVKSPEGDWTYTGLGEGQVFDTEAFLTTANRLTSLRMLEPLGTEGKPAYGFGEPGAVVVLGLQDESGSTSQLTLTIGGILDGTNYVAKASNSPYYVKITPTHATELVEMAHETLLVAEPTPTPEP